MIRNASLSADGVYRYVLGRQWNYHANPSREVVDLWVMLNPSIADASVDDATIRRCVGFSRSWGSDGLRVVNLFALRATNPDALGRHPDPVGPDNDAVLRTTAVVTRSLGGRVIAAWGAHKLAAARAWAIRDLLGDSVESLGTTKAGAPRHPLYVKADTPLTTWRAA